MTISILYTHHVYYKKHENAENSNRNNFYYFLQGNCRIKISLLFTYIEHLLFHRIFGVFFSFHETKVVCERIF